MLIFVSIGVYFFYPLYIEEHIIVDYGIYPFDICVEQPVLWKYCKIWFVVTYIFSSLFFSNSFYHLFSKWLAPPKGKKTNSKELIQKKKGYSLIYPKNNSKLQILVGKSVTTNELIYLPEKSLYQNIFITGTIGTGKTSSAMYPFTKQLIEYSHDIFSQKLGMLILDVKGNYFQKVLEFAESCGRKEDVIVIELNGKFCYNPLDKPNLKASVLANRLKTILLLFSKNNSESYWLDKAEQILEAAIKLCRLYNNGYVTFEELHKLIMVHDYYLEKVNYLRELFLKNSFSKSEIYDLLSSLNFFEKEYLCLDQRTLSILKSEITRITNCFISDYDVLNTFCPPKEKLNFYGFSEVLEQGKIVVLHLNINEYSSLSRIIAAYLKLDFQTDVMTRLASGETNDFRSVCFISDEYSEYVTDTDSNFFSQSREAKCINIVATQSYTSLLNTLHDQASVNVIIQNLINKLWFRSDDIFTIETAQKQIGKEDKEKISRGISENAKETVFSYFTNSLNSKNSSISETVNTTVQVDYVYDTNFFTQNLKNFHCLSFLSDGTQIRKPEELQLFPYFEEKFI